VLSGIGMYCKNVVKLHTSLHTLGPRHRLQSSHMSFDMKEDDIEISILKEFEVRTVYFYHVIKT
jgi:hypothetical protein